MKFELIKFPATLGKKPLNTHKDMANIVKSVKRTANGHALQMLKLFHKTTSTWNHQPKFNFKTEETSDGIVITIWTDDDIYRWVDQGTTRRFMHMTKDFVPKTVPGVIGSGRGFGGPAYIGAPLPGIIARRFTDAIFAEKAPIAIRSIEERFRKEVSNTFIRMF